MKGSPKQAYRCSSPVNFQRHAIPTFFSTSCFVGLGPLRASPLSQIDASWPPFCGCSEFYVKMKRKRKGPYCVPPRALLTRIQLFFYPPFRMRLFRYTPHLLPGRGRLERGRLSLGFDALSASMTADLCHSLKSLLKSLPVLFFMRRVFVTRESPINQGYP